MTRSSFAAAALLALVFLAAPAAAQGPASDPPYDDADASYSEPPELSVRPFFLVTGQNFAAKESFKAIFGRSVQPFWGAGVQLAARGGAFVDFAVSRLRVEGERAFRFEDQNFGLGIPLTATETALEVSGGYRFRVSPSLIPYVGGGIGSYGYEESSDFANDGDDISTRHIGYLLSGGAEFRVARWLGLSTDVQYTRVPGILGEGGISKDTGEDDLGGIAAHFRVIIGR